MDTEQSYTDNSILTSGDYKFTTLSRVPAKYLLHVYYHQNKNNKFPDKKLIKYIEENLDVILQKKLNGDVVVPLEMPCKKVAYASEKIAKDEIRRIQGIKQDHKKPIRTYECEICGGWHLTSISFEGWNKK